MGLEVLKDMPTEQATIDDIAVDGLVRHENSILANVPNGLADKGIVAVRLFHYFLDGDTVCEFTGKKTMLDLEESYIMSGVYSDEHLWSVYQKIEKEVEKSKGGTTWVEYEYEYKVLNRNEDMRIRSEARRFWMEHQLDTMFLEAQQYKRGNIPFTDQLKFAIETDALRPGDTANRKMAMDIHAMKNKFGGVQINVYHEGKGKQLNKTIIEASGNDNYDLGLDYNDDTE